MEPKGITRSARLLYYYNLAKGESTACMTWESAARLLLVEVDTLRFWWFRIAAELPKKVQARKTSTQIIFTFAGDSDSAENVRTVFEYWVNSHRKASTTKLNDQRRSKIKARLRDGFTVDQLKGAIDGVLLSEFHVAGRHTDIATVLKSAGTVERHLETYKEAKGSSGILAHMANVGSRRR